MTLLSLALDGSGPSGGVALLEGDRIIEATTCPEGPGFGVTLYARVEGILAGNHLSVSDMSLLTVTLGPGSFTGLRFALGLAKGMALVHTIPLIGISTLALLAEEAKDKHPWILPLRDAGNGFLFYALYNALPDGIQEVTPPTMGQPQDVLTTLAAGVPEGTVYCCGPGVDPYAKSLMETLQDRLHTPNHPFAQPSPALLGQMGRMRFLQGAKPADLNLEPLYLRPPQAEMNLLESGK